MKNYYLVLGVEQDADQRMIRKAWHARARELHPDHHPDDPTAEEMFKEAQEAYSILSDPFLRKRYDEGGFKSMVSAAPSQEVISHYFYAKVVLPTIREFDELEVYFTYTGQGRMFRRPSFTGFFITGPPYVSHRLVSIKGVTLKETTFKFIVCPTEAGMLTIGRAGITIANQSLFTEPIPVHVLPNRCHFSKSESADGKPLKVTLHFDFKGQEEKAPRSELKKNHVVLVPRSRTAFIFHSIGMTMKIVFMIWGAIMLKYYLGVPLFLGALAGAALGGMNVLAMYRLAGVKSKQSHARKYQVVDEYLRRGYRLGELTGMPTARSSVFYEFQKLLF